MPKIIKKTTPALLAFVLLLIFFGPAQAQDSSPVNKVHIYLFWGEGCPHCAAEKPFLEELAEKYPGVELHFYEIYYDASNQNLFMAMAAKFGFDPQAVPTTFIGEKYWVGYSEQLDQEIETYVQMCLENGCPDAGEGVISPLQSGSGSSPSAETVESPPEQAPPSQERTLNLPIIGTVNLDQQSLLVSTALIAFVDGFNPCSLWALSMLMALVLHTGSRKKILLIGLVFLTVTSLVYVLFIAGLFSVLSFISYLGWVQVIVALVALTFAMINIKDYFWYKEGVSLTIKDEKKPGLFAKMRRVVNASDSFWGLVGATIVLAAGVSLVEFSCTSGFPVIWTNLLTSQGVTAGTFVVLLILYMIIYQIDELAIFLGVVFTLRASRFEEKHGRILKLIGGVLMLALAVVMLVDPALMNSLSTSLIIFGGAFLLAALILLLHRTILPKFGIWIGTREGETAKKGKPKKRHA